MCDKDNIKMALNNMFVIFKNGTKQNYINIYQFEYEKGVLKFTDKDFKDFIISLDQVEKFNIYSVYI